uniref:DUF1876 domain-containing protein n=2 Tax=Nonomuraea gerenzanensis TaxID=93944 RepID=A0A1M4EBX4_9ACTN|nr:hypothetical protein BN4615_P5629 [Nonomuraea gerenzanensis]
MEAKQWTVRIHLTEDGDDTTALAVLITRGGGRVDGLGRARRHPADPSVPEVGDELAASRALADLAGKLSALSREPARPASAPLRRRGRGEHLRGGPPAREAVAGSPQEGRRQREPLASAPARGRASSAAP